MREAFAARRKRSRADFATTQSHIEGLSSTLSLPWQNHLGDSRAERENDSRFWEPLSFHRWNHPGDSSVANAPSE